MVIKISLRNSTWPGCFIGTALVACICVVTVLSVEANYSNRRMCILFSCSVAKFEYVNL